MTIGQRFSVYGAILIGLCFVARAEDPVPLTKIEPAYPQKLNAIFAGKAKVKAQILPSGEVAHVEILEESPAACGFGAMAAAALQQWTFSPSKLGGTFVLEATMPPPPQPQEDMPFEDIGPRWGQAQLLVSVDGLGAVFDIEVIKVSNKRNFDRSAMLAAVRKWTFEKGTCGTYGLTVRYELD